MPRIRTVKPHIWANRQVASVSHEARLLFIGLITLADDEGRFMALPTTIGGHVYPFEPEMQKRLPKLLAELEGIGLVELYGEHYGQLPTWHEHQRISHKTPSVLPSPSGITPEDFRNGSGEIHELVRSTSGAAPS